MTDENYALWHMLVSPEDDSPNSDLHRPMEQLEAHCHQNCRKTSDLTWQENIKTLLGKLAMAHEFWLLPLIKSN